MAASLEKKSGNRLSSLKVTEPSMLACGRAEFACTSAVIAMVAPTPVRLRCGVSQRLTAPVFERAGVIARNACCQKMLYGVGPSVVAASVCHFHSVSVPTNSTRPRPTVCSASTMRLP